LAIETKLTSQLTKRKIKDGIFILEISLYVLMLQKELFKIINFGTKTIGGQYGFFSNKTAEILLPLLPIINSVSGHEADEPTA
jgi:hypothetical protein